MALYTFYPCKLDGGSESFVTREVLDDDHAYAWARRVLDEHPSATYVVAWSGERKVLTVQRGSDLQFASEPGAQNGRRVIPHSPRADAR